MHLQNALRRRSFWEDRTDGFTDIFLELIIQEIARQ